MNRTHCITAFGLILIIVFISVPLTAQENTSGAAAVTEHKHLITTNPFLILFSWWNIEYEYKLASHSTIGLAGSYVSLDDEGNDKTVYAGGYVIYRYYPSGKAHSGFYFGSRLGITGVEVEYYDDTVDEDGTAYGFGIDVGYTWLLGESEMFAISMGVGATRLFGSDLEDGDAFLPIIRLVNVGVAF